MAWLVNPPVLFELALTALFVAIAVFRPRFAARPLASLEGWFRALPTEGWRPILLVMALAVAARLAFLPWLGPPPLLIHDEFSLLLQAETFLQGRLAMPPHPLGAFFETFHINQWPHYASIYFPGRSAPLLVGLLLFGHPWFGVWLSFVALAGATVWMLRAWVSPRLALLGGILVVLRFGVFSYWINSYWGGAFTALGAMLVVGALPRIMAQPRWRDGLILGVSVFILMTTRPYEGLLLCAGMGLAFMPRLVGKGLNWLRPAAMKAGVPLALLTIAGAGLLLAYNQASTGDPLATPYQLNREAYAIAPAFLFTPPLTDDTRYAGKPDHIQSFYQDEAKPHIRARSGATGLAASVLGKLRYIWSFYVGWALSIPFLLGLWASRREWIVPAALAIFLVGFALTTWAYPHYAAPAMPLLLILAMRGLAALREAPRPDGRFLALTLPLASVAPLAVPALAVTLGTPALEHNSWNAPCCALRQSTPKTEIAATLTRAPGRDLVFVESGPFRPIHEELVFNGPLIDDQPIVWAHSLGSARDRKLIARYPDRLLWRVRWIGPQRFVVERIDR